MPRAAVDLQGADSQPEVRTPDLTQRRDFFGDGLSRFQDTEAVAHGQNNGLGPRFNLNACSGCHMQPTIGGSGGSTNPQYTAVQTGMAGPTNSIPGFITPNGPTREARFPFFFNNNGTVNTSAPNGGVETLFTVGGLPFAGTCNISQPDYAAAAAADNVIFRIPTPVFGAGLIENIDDSTLMAIRAANAGNTLGVSGTFNRNGNDGTIAKSAGRRRTSRCCCLPARPTTSRWASPVRCFPRIVPCPRRKFGGTACPRVA